jgi:hypothetical protein
VIHVGCEDGGHAAKSYHYPKTSCKAVDFDVGTIGTKENFPQQVATIEAALKEFGEWDHVGFGIYPDWNSPGFHLDTRGFGAYWVYQSGEYSYGNDKILAYLESKGVTV